MLFLLVATCWLFVQVVHNAGDEVIPRLSRDQHVCYSGQSSQASASSFSEILDIENSSVLLCSRTLDMPAALLASWL